MGVSYEQLRTDGQAGSVDLSILTDSTKVKQVAFRTKSGLWYHLAPHPETRPTSHSTLAPVCLEFGPQTRINGGVWEEAELAWRWARNWASERRHFRTGLVEIKNALVTPGDPLIINDHATSPVDVGWVTEYTDPAEAAVLTCHPDRGWIGYVTLANF